MSSTNHIKDVAIVGASGNSGSYITEALLKAGKHTITAITRADSKTELPTGVQIKHIDYNAPATIAEALTGQDALVITLSGFAPADTQEKLIRAAADAGVPWILPNEWAPDTANEDLVRDVPFGFPSKPVARKLITDLGKSSFIGVSTGFWYEWSLPVTTCFGINFAKRQASFYDDGETKITTSTWPQVGRAVAALLSLPIKPEGGANQEACLENFRNQMVYISSFTLSQKEMFASALRVTETEESDWTITSASSREIYEEGMEQIRRGDKLGFAKTMYPRVFFTDGVGNTEKSRGTLNELLGLPTEDLDEATKRAELRSQIRSG